MHGLALAQGCADVEEVNLASQLVPLLRIIDTEVQPVDLLKKLVRGGVGLVVVLLCRRKEGTLVPVHLASQLAHVNLL